MKQTAIKSLQLGLCLTFALACYSCQSTKKKAAEKAATEMTDSTATCCKGDSTKCDSTATTPCCGADSVKCDSTAAKK